MSVPVVGAAARVDVAKLTPLRSDLLARVNLDRAQQHPMQSSSTTMDTSDIDARVREKVAANAARRAALLQSASAQFATAKPSSPVKSSESNTESTLPTVVATTLCIDVQAPSINVTLPESPPSDTLTSSESDSQGPPSLSALRESARIARSAAEHRAKERLERAAGGASPSLPLTVKTPTSSLLSPQASRLAAISSRVTSDSTQTGWIRAAEQHSQQVRAMVDHNAREVQVLHDDTSAMALQKPTNSSIVSPIPDAAVQTDPERDRIRALIASLSDQSDQIQRNAQATAAREHAEAERRRRLYELESAAKHDEYVRQRARADAAAASEAERRRRIAEYDDIHRESKLHRSLSVAAVVASVAKELHSRVSQLESESLESQRLRSLAQRRVEAAMEVERAHRMLSEQQQIAEEEGRNRLERTRSISHIRSEVESERAHRIASFYSQEQAALQSDLKQRAAARAFAAEAIELERDSRLSPELRRASTAPVDQHTAHALRRQATMAAEQERQRQITELHAHYMSERASADAERNERRRAVAEKVAAEKLRQIEQHAALVDQSYKNDRLQRRASLTHTAAMMEQERARRLEGTEVPAFVPSQSPTSDQARRAAAREAAEQERTRLVQGHQHRELFSQSMAQVVTRRFDFKASQAEGVNMWIERIRRGISAVTIPLIESSDGRDSSSEDDDAVELSSDEVETGLREREIMSQAVSVAREAALRGVERSTNVPTASPSARPVFGRRPAGPAVHTLTPVPLAVTKVFHLFARQLSPRHVLAHSLRAALKSRDCEQLQLAMQTFHASLLHMESADLTSSERRLAQKADSALNEMLAAREHALKCLQQALIARTTKQLESALATAAACISVTQEIRQASQQARDILIELQQSIPEREHLKQVAVRIRDLTITHTLAALEEAASITVDEAMYPENSAAFKYAQQLHQTAVSSLSALQAQHAEHISLLSASLSGRRSIPVLDAALRTVGTAHLSDELDLWRRRAVSALTELRAQTSSCEKQMRAAIEARNIELLTAALRVLESVESPSDELIQHSVPHARVLLDQLISERQHRAAVAARLS